VLAAYNPLYLMQILSVGNRVRISLLLIASSPALAAERSKATVSLNSVASDLTVQRDIRADDLEVLVDGKQSRVVSLSLDSRPRRVVMMVDDSGSMTASGQSSGWGTAFPTVVFAINSTPSNASVALVTFGDKLLQESNGFEDRQGIGTRVRELATRKPRGHTALFDSIDEAVSLFEEPQLGDTTFLVADGNDNKSRTSLRKLREKLIAHGVRVFFFYALHEGFVPGEEMEGASLMEQLAEFTGGYFIRIPWNEIRGNEQAWSAKLSPQIASQVEGIYQLELDLSGSVGSTACVKVAFVDRKRERNTRLVYPRQLKPSFQKP
jgi:hypothetical protein